MSYSFNVVSATKAEATAEAEAKFEEVVEQMPIHEKDKAMVLAHMRNTVVQLADPEDSEQVYVSVSGYIASTNPTAGPSRVTTCSASCSASLGRKPT